MCPCNHTQPTAHLGYLNRTELTLLTHLSNSPHPSLYCSTDSHLSPQHTSPHALFKASKSISKTSAGRSAPHYPSSLLSLQDSAVLSGPRAPSSTRGWESPTDASSRPRPHPWGGKGGAAGHGPSRLAAAFALTVVCARSHGHDPERQRDRDEQAQDDDVRQHLEVVPEEILLAACHGEPEGGRLRGGTRHRARQCRGQPCCPAALLCPPAVPLSRHLRTSRGAPRGAPGELPATAPRPLPRALPAPKRPRTASARGRKRRQR